MSLTKPVQIDKHLHKKLKEASAWHVQSVKEITERALETELRLLYLAKLRAIERAESKQEE